MTPQEIIQKIKQDLSKGSGISQALLSQVKKYFEEAKNQQTSTQQKPTQLLIFKEKIIGLFLTALTDNNLTSKEKNALLEILERDLISTKHNANLFNRLYYFLINQEENVAIQATKTIDALIKQINDSKHTTPGAVPLEMKTHYIKLFQFLKERTDFLLRLNEHVRDPEFKVFRRQSYEQRDRDKQNKEKDKNAYVFKNSKSLKFINQVPHLFIHLMAYVDTTNRSSEQECKVRELIRKSIENIIQALKKTPYQEFYNEFNYEFNNQLFGVMTKLLQFLFISLKSEKQNTRDNNASNLNLKKHIAQQLEYIKVPEVIKNFIYLLKNCSEDFQLNRYQIVNRLKLLLNNLDKNKLNKTDAMEIMNDILNEEIVFGKKKIIGDYSKNALYSFWIQIIKSPVLYTHVFPVSLLSTRSISQTSISEDNPEVTNCFKQIDKLMEEVLKTIFDNSIYPSVQEKAIQLLVLLVDQMFPEGSQPHESILALNTNPVAKRIHENKLKVLQKIMNCVALKFQSIRDIFEEIDEYVTNKLGHPVTKADLPEPLKLQHMQLGSLNISIAETDDWQKQVIDLIQNYKQEIDNSLLTISTPQNKFLTIYEEEDQLCFNSHPVRMSNYTLYMKEVKTKLLERLITLSLKITKIFIHQNLDVYSPFEVNSLKSIYFILNNKKPLTQEQCSTLSQILKNGLKIFELLHNYDLHSDEQTSKKGHLKNFMLIFAQIYDPVNFRDIFEPNMDDFFRNLIFYVKYCPDYCLQFVLIEPFCSNTTNQNQQFNKNIVELLIYNLILRLEETSDQLDPFHDFYNYKQEYFSLLQKLIRFPFRCLSRYSDDSFIRNYFRQIILTLIKKTHSSRFCLDYLHLMRTLFKNILFNANRQATSPLFSQFYAICNRKEKNQQQPNQNSVFININLLDNFYRLFQTGIPELADIVTELIIMLPLKSKHIITLAKDGYIVKPFLQCLCLMSDYNYTLRILKTFEIIISHSTSEEINTFLDGVKDKLINRLFEIVAQCKLSALKMDKISNDLSSLSLKLLAKLGALSRNRDVPIQMLPKNQEQPITITDLELVFTEIKTQKIIKSSMTPCIEYAIDIFNKLLDSYYQYVVYISMEMIQSCFQLLREAFPLYLQKMHPLSERIITVFSSILALSSKYLTISQSILNRIRENVKTQIKSYAQVVKEQLRKFGLNQYSRFFVRCLVINMHERVLITREDHFIKEIAHQPKNFLWGLLTNMLQEAQGTQSYEQTYKFVIDLLISQIVMIKNPCHIKINPYQNEYNHVLPYKNAALSAMSQLIDKVPQNVLDEMHPQILQSVFIAVISVPNILNLKIMQHPRIIAKKIYDFMLKDQEAFLKRINTEKGQETFNNILENLVSHSTEAHDIAAMLLEMIMKNTKLNLHEILYGNQPWEEICDNTSNSTRTQAKYTFDHFNNKETKKFPLVHLIKTLLRVAHNITKENLTGNDRMIRTLANAFSTFQMLISIKSTNHPGSTFQAFTVLGKVKQNEDFADDNIIFHQKFIKIIKIAQQIININSAIYENYVKIIIEQPNQQQQPNVPNTPSQAQGTPGNPQNPPRAIPPNIHRPRDAPTNVVPSNNPQNFNINVNTFIDDQEYNLNIQDLDMDVKVWGQLISSILKFLKTILVNDNVFQISKSILRKKNEKSKLIETRLEIIFVMFDLIGRVDRTVRSTAYSCLKQLLSRQQHPKDLIQNDDKLKQILRPVLISLQLQFKKFTPSFLHMFKKILKLLTQCFNITLIQKLVQKLKEIQKNKELQHQNTYSKTMSPPIKHPNYSQITTQVKCIANFLGLFQHLAYAYHNHRYMTYTINSIIDIFKNSIAISNYFSPKLGKHTIKIQIKKTLAKVLNTMSEKLPGQNLFGEGLSRDQDLEHFLQILNLEDSYPLRQRLTREFSYIQKNFDEMKKNPASKSYLIFLQIIETLAKFNGMWLKNCNNLANKLVDQLQHAIRNRSKKFQERQEQDNGDRCQIVLLLKILLQYIKFNRDNIEILFPMMDVFKLRATFDLHFFRKYLRYKLYNNLTPELRKKLLVQFLAMVRSHNERDQTDRALAISQNIIYHFILKQLSLKQNERCLLVNDQEILKAFSETIKQCLNSKFLYRRCAKNYRIAIELLQLSNLTLEAWKNFLQQPYKNSMLPIVWGLLRIQDKMIKNYAFVWTSNYIRIFDGFQQPKALGLYLTLIRGLENLNQGDYQNGALIKKALNVLIPYWDSRPEVDSRGNRQNNNWIDWSLRAVHQQSNEPSRLVRFWEIVVKNHKIFHKFKQSKFETQMVNSMQWLMVANNPTSANPLVKKIASDMSFIYIEWKYQQTKEKLKSVSKKSALLQDIVNDRAAQICLNFFIKVALNNCTDRDDKQIMKRSLYLLKKTLILWPNTKKKFEGIKTIVNKLRNNANQQTQNNESPIRFHYTLLNIINILLLYETDQKLLPQLYSIFKLLELCQVNQPRMPLTNQGSSPISTIFTMNNIYLMHLLGTIVKRLVKVAIMYQKDEQSMKLMQQIHGWIKQGFEFYVLASTNRTRANPSQPIARQASTKKIQIQVAISFLKILFDLDAKSIDIHLNYIKQVTSTLKKMFEKGFQSSRTNNSNRVYDLPNLTEGSFQQMMKKDMEISVDLIKKENLLQAEQNYEKEIIKSYVTRRPLFVILLRILAAKFDSISHVQDQNNVLQIFLSIYEKIPDPQLKMEIINILKCLFIGASAFDDGTIPERYKSITKINYPTNKIFFLLFDNNSQFYNHFENRKVKPSDQNYNINEKLYEEITTKSYFQFLCKFIYQLDEITSEYMEKIKIFVLYAIKAANDQHIYRLFEIIDRSYGDSPDFYACLFEDYKDLKCAEDFLEGDQIMLFFTSFLYWKGKKKYRIHTQAFGGPVASNFAHHYQKLISGDQVSFHHLELLRKTIKVSIELLPYSSNLPRIMQDYLLNGNYQQAWGSTLLKMAIDFKCLSSQELYYVCVKIAQWGTLLREIQSNSNESSKIILDYIYRAYNDKDLIYGYRMGLGVKPGVQEALVYLQQRKYNKVIQILANNENEELKRLRISNAEDQWFGQQFSEETGSNIEKFKNVMQNTIIDDIYKESCKNLNRWEEVITTENAKPDYLSKIDFLFHSNSHKDKFSNVLEELNQIQLKQFAFYYGKSIQNFLQSPTSQTKQLTVSLLYSLFEWMCFPKNAKLKQNDLLVQIQCLLELQEGQKIKQQSIPNSSEQTYMIEALTKVVQSIYSQINLWRQRMPNKHQDLSVWHAILGQRNTIYEYMKKRMSTLLEGVQNLSSQSMNVNKLLIPYTDIQWNNLKILRQERSFYIYNSLSKINPNQLYMEEIFMKEKESFYYQWKYKKNQVQALKALDNAINVTCREDSPQKIELLRLKAQLYTQKSLFSEATTVLNEAIKIQLNHSPLWKDWFKTCIKAFEETKEKQWAISAISILPETLLYKTYQNRILIAPIFKMLNHFSSDQDIASALKLVIEEVPMKAFLLWIPQLLRLSENKVFYQSIQKLLFKLGLYDPQTVFFAVKNFFKADKLEKLKVVRDLGTNIKRVFFNLIIKLQVFTQLPIELKNCQKISVNSIGALSRKLSEIQVPLYQRFKGQIQNTKIPQVLQISQIIEKEIMNGVQGKVIKLLADDGKQYSYRIQRTEKCVSPQKKDLGNDFEILLTSQFLEIVNTHLEKWRESSIRHLNILQARKIYTNDQTVIMRSDNYSVTLLDILNKYIQDKTSFSPDYPDNDKSFMKLPKNQINKSVNTRMKEIVTSKTLKEYFLSKAIKYDDYVTFRKTFSYQYAATLAINYFMSIETQLPHCLIDLKTAKISLFHYFPSQIVIL